MERVKPQLYDLVACHGYYGILVAENEVFCGNGCQFVLEPEEVEQLVALPIYHSRAVIDNPLTARANFAELFERQARLDLTRLD